LPIKSGSAIGRLSGINVSSPVIVTSSAFSTSSHIATSLAVGTSSHVNITNISYQHITKNQPLTFKYPRWCFGKGSGRCFNKYWYKPYPWIHYDEQNDAVFCATCTQATQKLKLLTSMKREDTFLSIGYRNWKHGNMELQMHDRSACHCASTEVIELSDKGTNIEEVLSTVIAKEKSRNQLQDRGSQHKVIITKKEILCNF
jgi:hypothetical protein